MSAALAFTVIDEIALQPWRHDRTDPGTEIAHITRSYAAALAKHFSKRLPRDGKQAEFSPALKIVNTGYSYVLQRRAN